MSTCSDSSTTDVDDDMPECSICLDDISTLKSVRIECGHRFHVECILRWVGSNTNRNCCPHCRSKFTSKSKLLIESSATYPLAPPLHNAIPKERELPPHDKKTAIKLDDTTVRVSGSYVWGYRAYNG